VHARNAALLALAATADLFSEDDCATKLLPIMCPSLVDKEKLIRDQAQKSVDIYIARIRKFAATMPDTVLPPPGLASGGESTPRIGTPANGTSWTGWAISSFTNKLASTAGEMQASSTTNGGVSTKPGMPLHSAKSTASIPTIKSPEPAAAFDDEAEDFNNDWGGFADEEDKPQEEEDPWGTPAVSKPASTTSYDDKGEPDFAGWLAAQSNAKKPTKNALPKGLTRSATPVAKTARPAVGSRSSTTGTTRKVIVPPKKEVKKEEPKANEDEEEGWGDAW
jgi:SCY1-like protein 1